MASSIPFSTMGNGLWEIDMWEMGFVWLLVFWGFSIANDREMVICWETEDSQLARWIDRLYRVYMTIIAALMVANYFNFRSGGLCTIK